ncbi:MAG: 3-deoxy-7-phosphoheptulonate synthase [Fusobacteria bacterium]|nr:3-deoxy-7-phosphoheptulonate synthase [Fusobacteriota bacterium]
MIVKMSNRAEKKDIEKLISHIMSRGLEIRMINIDKGLFGILGDITTITPQEIERYQHVESVIQIQKPYKKASRLLQENDTVIDIRGIKIGGSNFTVIAGPCSVESEIQICDIATSVKKSGAKFLRGGAFKPRTSPYAFQGLEFEGLDLLQKARAHTGLPIVSEITSTKLIDEFVEKVDIIQVGARNMQNFDLLKELGKMKKPILLKRGLSATIEEWLMSAEYILAGGNENVILCERGIRTFENSMRNTLDISAISMIKKISHLPIIIDPSHASGKWWMVESLSKAAVAAGADGLMIEVHNNPENALSDGAQSLKLDKFEMLMKDVFQIAKIVGKNITL